MTPSMLLLAAAVALALACSVRWGLLAAWVRSALSPKRPRLPPGPIERAPDGGHGAIGDLSRARPRPRARYVRRGVRSAK